MTRALIAFGFVLLLSVVICPTDTPAVPHFAVYFDPALTQSVASCPFEPPGTVFDTLYVAADGFDTPLEGVEYKLTVPSELIWIADLDLGNGLQIGASVSGTSIAFFEPVDASGPVIVQAIVVLWLCNECSTFRDEVSLTPHPATGSISAVTSDLGLTNVVGLPAVVCPLINGVDPGTPTTLYHAPAAGQAAVQCELDCPAGDGGVILPGGLPAEIHNPDLDNDGVVTYSDWAEFATYLHAMFDADADFYCSGAIDLLDFVLFTRHWEHSAPVGVEPSTWGRIKAQFTK